MSTLPQGFIDFVRSQPALNVLEQSLGTEPEVSVRLNPAKSAGKSSSQVIAQALAGDPVPWCADGRYLAERPQFTFDIALHQGLYYVQDASSMCISTVVDYLSQLINGPIRYLDACAAPGGKTTAAISRLNAESLVVANEYDFKRAEILAENISKWGEPNVVVSRGNTSRISKLKDFFNIIAVDAPCSGEGMMRKESKAVGQWSPSLIRDCAATQREIIGNIWPALAPGGYLVYSTCTFNLDENENNLQWIIDEFSAEPVAIPALEGIESISHGIDTDIPCYRFIPGIVRGEGLFIAVVRKPGDLLMSTNRAKPAKLPKELSAVTAWLNTPCDISVKDNEVFAIPVAVAADAKAVSKSLDTIAEGVHIASVKGKDIIPTHDLALSTILAPGAFATVDIDKNDALKYLRRDNIVMPEGTPRGYVLLTFDNTPLGFVKNLGNRTNSLLPKNWRILSQQK